MTTPISSIDNTTLLNLTPNLDIGDVADPALRLAYFQYLNVYIQSITTAFNAFVANGSIGSGNLADLSVLTAKIAELAVTTGKIAELAVTTSKLNNMAVTLAKMAANSVGTTQLVDLSVSQTKIALGAVGSQQLDPALIGVYGDIAIRAALNKMRYDVTEPPFYAIGDGSDETTKIQAAISAAIAANTKLVFFPKGAYSATALTGLDQVSLVGNNATLTVGAESVYVEQLSGVSGLKSKSASMYARALNEEYITLDSLKNSISAINATSTLRIAIVGDSITENGALNNIDDSYAARLIASLTKAIPTINIVSQNFGLGQRSISMFTDANYKGLASEPADITTGFYRTWSTVGKSWIDHVKDFTPDLVIVAFGMNDSTATGTSDADFAYFLNLALTTINSWTVKADTMLVTTILPTTNYALYPQNQNATKAVARVTRTFAINNNLALADPNRLWQILRDGVDDVGRVSNYEKNWINYPTGWTNTSGYSLVSGVLTPSTGGLVERSKTFYNGTIEVSVNPSATGATGETQIIYRDDSTLGYMKLIVGAGSGTGYVKLYRYDTSTGLTLLQQVTTLTIPTGSATKIKIVAENDSHKVYVTDVLQLSQSTYSNMHEGYVAMGSVSSSYPTLSLLTVNYKDGLQGAPIYTEQELLGTFISPYDRGNGKNHPTPLGHGVAYLSAFNGLIKELSSRKLIDYNYFSRQAIIGGNFDSPWQRGTTFTNPVNNVYTADRFKTSINADGGTPPTNIIHSRQLLTSGDIPNAFYFYRINVDGAGSAYGVNSIYAFHQWIENATRYLCGINKKLTLSFWARSSITSKKVSLALLQNYGTGGSPSTQETLTGKQTFTLTAVWKKYTVVFTSNTLAGKTFGTNNDDNLKLVISEQWGASSALGDGVAESFVGAGNIDFAQMMLNSGDLALSFQPKDVDDEAKKAMRFTWIPQTNSVYARLTTYTANTLVFDVPLPVQLRTIPTIRGTVNTDIVANTVAGVAQTGFTAAALLTSSGVRVTLTKAAHGLTDAVLEIKTTSGFEAEL